MRSPFGAGVKGSRISPAERAATGHLESRSVSGKEVAAVLSRPSRVSRRSGPVQTVVRLDASAPLRALEKWGTIPRDRGASIRDEMLELQGNWRDGEATLNLLVVGSIPTRPTNFPLNLGPQSLRI